MHLAHAYACLYACQQRFHQWPSRTPAHRKRQEIQGGSLACIRIRVVASICLGRFALAPNFLGLFFLPSHAQQFISLPGVQMTLKNPTTPIPFRGGTECSPPPTCRRIRSVTDIHSDPMGMSISGNIQRACSAIYTRRCRILVLFEPCVRCQ